MSFENPNSLDDRDPPRTYSMEDRGWGEFLAIAAVLGVVVLGGLGYYMSSSGMQTANAPDATQEAPSTTGQGSR